MSGPPGHAASAAVRIATVCKPLPLSEGDLRSMDTIRWVRVSERLAAAGFRVDMIVGAGARLSPRHPNLRYVTAAEADWSAYDVIKTLYPRGFRELLQAGGGSHPFIISRLASVVGATDSVPGVHFLGPERQERYEIAQQIHRTSRYIAFSSEPNRELWRREYGTDPARLLMVPTGVDRTIPPPRRNPYQGLSDGGKIVVYVGNIYTTTQRHVNLLWQDRLNRLGRLLRKRGMRLVFVGPGLTDCLDQEAVVNVGPVAHDDVWDYQYFADVGIALAQGPVHYNEASKIYYYLRTGLPVVSEEPLPNNDVIAACGLGLVAPYNDDQALAEMVEAAAHHRWDKEAAIAYVLAHHTWDQRVATYVRVIAEAPGE